MSLNWILVICFGVLIMLAVTVYNMPVEKRRKRKTKTAALSPDLKQKEEEWEEKKVRYESQISGLKREMERLNAEMKRKDEEVLSEKAHVKKIQEKLEQERGWRNKEEEDIQKLKGSEIRLKDLLAQAEETLSQEHAHKIRVQRELDELKRTKVALTEENRKQSVQILDLDKTLKETQKNLRETKWQNNELSKKKEAEQWVAKYDYDAVVDKLRDKEREIVRLQKAIDAASPFKNLPPEDIPEDEKRSRELS